MKRDLRILSKGGVDFNPITETDAVGHSQMKSSLTKLINSYNLTTCFPTSGIGGLNTYTIDLAIKKLDEVLTPEQKIPGVHAEFTTKEGKYEEWEFIGEEYEFKNILGWRQVDSRVLLDLLEEVFPLSSSMGVSPGIVKTNTTNNITISWSVKRKGKDVTKDSNVQLNGEKVEGNSKKESVSFGEHKTNTYKLVASYQGLTTSSSGSVTAVDDCYYNLVDEGWKPNESEIKGFTKTNLKNTKSYTWANMNIPNKCICYAYPTYHGALSSILDANGYNYIDSYTRSTLTIDGVSYYAYVSNNATTAEGYLQTFK